MRRAIIICVALFALALTATAQRKEIDQARTCLKSGKDLDKAENTLQKLLSDSANRRNVKVYLLLYQIQKKQYEQGNDKLFLKERYDTAALFNVARRMFATVRAIDSIDVRPNKKGVVAPKYRDRHAKELSTYRQNLFYGGAYYMRKKEYETAYGFFSDFIQCDSLPVFVSGNDTTNNALAPQAAYWSTVCGLHIGDPNRALRYSRLALRYKPRLSRTLRNIAEAHLAQKDTANYVATLRQGFDSFPADAYFFPRLVSRYVSTDSLDLAKSLADTLLGIDSCNVAALTVCSDVALAQGSNDGCINVSDKLISINDSLPDPYYNAGTAYINKAIKAEQTPKTKGRRDKASTELYRKALPYMERYRQLAPNEKLKWGAALYRIYFNLNMGKQFDEIDRLLGE